MNIGELRHLVTFGRPSVTRDSYGQVNEGNNYTEYAQRRVSIKPTDSKEVLAGNKPEGVTTFTITGRYLRNVQLNDRIVWGIRVFEIAGIKNLEERNLWHEMTAIELFRPVEMD